MGRRRPAGLVAPVRSGRLAVQLGPVGRARPPEQESLPVMRADIAGKFELRGGLDAFDDAVNVQCAGESDDGAEDGRVERGGALGTVGVGQ